MLTLAEVKYCYRVANIAARRDKRYGKDAVQYALEHILRKLARPGAPTERPIPRSWLFTHVRFGVLLYYRFHGNVSVWYQRKGVADPEVLPEDFDPAAPAYALDPETCIDLRRRMERLRPVDLQLLFGKLEGRSEDELVETLGWTRRAVNSRFSKFHQKAVVPRLTRAMLAA